MAVARSDADSPVPIIERPAGTSAATSILSPCKVERDAVVTGVSTVGAFET